MRAAGAADDGAHLRRPLEERPTPPRRPPTHSPRPRREERREPCRPPCPRRDGGAPLSSTSGRNDQLSASLDTGRPEERSSGNPRTRSSERRRPPMTREEIAP